MNKTIKTLTITVLLLLTGLTAFAREPIIDYEKIELDNGARLICGYLPESPLVTVQIRVLSGLSNEGKYAGTGISHFLEHLLFKGTEEKNSVKLRKEIKAIGGTINGATGLDSAEYHIIAPNDKLEEALNLIMNMVMDPVFSDEEMEKEKDVILKEIRLRKDDPIRRRIYLLFSEAYETHVYGYPIIGGEETVKEITREDIAAYHALVYKPNRMVVGIVGGVPIKKIISLARGVIDEYEKGEAYAAEVPAETPQEEMGFSEFEEDVTLGYIAMGFKTTSLYSDDLYPVDVLSILLGEGNDSRLYKRLVKEKELLYAVSSFNYTPRYPGLFIITGIGEPEKLEEAREEIFNIIDEIKKNGVSKKEVQRAKNLVSSAYLHSHESAGNIAASMTNSEMLMGDPLFFQRYTDRVQKVRVEDVKKVIPKYFTKNNSTTVFLLPEDPLKEITEESQVKGQGAEDEMSEVRRNLPISTFILKKDEERRETKDEGFKESESQRVKESGETKDGRRGTKDERRETTDETKMITLDNGLKIIVKQRSRLPLVAVTFAAEGGLRLEKKENNGISNLMAALFLKGTKTRSEEEIVPIIEKHGGNISTFNGMNSMGVNLDLLSGELENGLDVLEDILKNSIFPEDEMIKLKKKTIAAIKEEDKDVFSNGKNNLCKLLYGDNPYAMRKSGEIDTVGGISRKDIIGFYKEHVIPQGSVITVVGDIDVDGVLADLEKRFSDWNGERKKRIGNQLEPVKERKRLDLNMSRTQALFLAGFQGIKISDDRRYPFSVISTILSGSDGLLFFYAREKKGIAYASGAINMPAVDPGYFVLYIATTEENLLSAEETIFDVLKRIRTGKIEEEEIESSKNRLITQNALSLEANSSISMRMALDELYGIGYKNYLSYSDKIRGVTKADIVSAAEDILDPDKSAIVVIHPE